MLKIIFPIIIMKLSLWDYMMFTFIILTFSAIPMLFFSFHLMSMSSNIFMLDPINTPLMLLTLWTSTLMLLASYFTMLNNSFNKEFLIVISILSLILMMAFSSKNMMSYYIFFEASLIPTLLLILGWGYQPERLQASLYLMLYTISASLPLLLALLNLNIKTKTLSFLLTSPMCMVSSLPIPFLILLSGAFLVKIPLYISHLWLPKAHVEAPVAGSMILAGILLKLGAYGITRMINIIPSISSSLMFIFSSISLWGGISTSLICLRQQDMKSLIAYSSVSHMSLLIMGIFSSSKWGWEGAVSMMIAHGLSSSCLFSMANMIYEFSKTRSLLLTKGLLLLFPTMSMWWFLMISANMAAPPTLNFLSEVMLLTSIMSSTKIATLPIIIITFMAAAYSLYLYTSIHHGNTSNYMNFISYPSSRNMLISIFHFVPIFMFIVSSVNITSSL
uniref:NADH dehydrogenase subunit 4 n=1 Tax=Clavisyllis tenjini TaxID=3041283 RepID=UPI002551D354|nr:NADH dehydrogenase subunit 4 [Clavisyllis tenjini]WGF21049.1 NADH dehydrogenase subunit 4 [Clavisyllis tenjini]